MEVSIDAARDIQIDKSSKVGGLGGGPNTEEGKEVVRWNATRHGIRSPAPVVPGVPENTEEWEDFDGWSAGAVRAGIEAIASATDEDPEKLLEVAIDAARRDVIGKQQAAEQVERDLGRMGRERLLPDEKILDKVSRYEAHLSRLMFKALHELEALQVRRSGGSAPLARPDVDGLSTD